MSQLLNLTPLVCGVVIMKIVLELYREETISFGKAAELLGVTKWEFTDLLRDKNVPLPYDEDDLEEDLQTLKDMSLW